MMVRKLKDKKGMGCLEVAILLLVICFWILFIQVLACLEYFDICGTSELTLEQAAEFWEIAGRCGSGI